MAAPLVIFLIVLLIGIAKECPESLLILVAVLILVMGIRGLEIISRELEKPNTAQVESPR